jgi:hypothetical protein
MIGYNKLGNNGRLGNQMFQYASLRGIAAKHGYEWCIPPENCVNDSNYGLFETFEMTNVKPHNIGYVNGPTIQESNHNLDSNLFDECPDNVNIHGYLQTEKYFKHIKEQILEDFAFKKDYLDPCKNFIESLDRPPIFLHIRRTDAVGREKFHPRLPLSYFEEALSNWSEDIPVFVSTDDLAWCKSQTFFDQDRFLFNESNDRYSYQTIDGTGVMQNTLLPQVDLCLMSLCHGGIIANSSSFSWWGAWLQNGRGTIIAPNPKTWFGPQLSHLNTCDMIPENWKIQTCNNII